MSPGSDQSESASDQYCRHHTGLARPGLGTRTQHWSHCETRTVTLPGLQISTFLCLHNTLFQLTITLRSRSTISSHTVFNFDSIS